MTAPDRCGLPQSGCTAAFTRVVQAGVPEARMQVLYSIRAGHPPQPFAPLIQYFRETGGLQRPAWQREVVRAVGLLLDFLAVHGGGAVDLAPPHALRAFAETLLCGTTHGGAVEYECLHWTPRSRERAARTLNLVTAFTDWLSNRTGRVRPNPWRVATPAERLLTVRRWERSTANALLRHAAYRRHEAVTAGRVREVQIARSADAGDRTEVQAFDAAHFSRLLLHGFARRVPAGAALERRLRLRDLLITLLLHAGGLRLSEVFHLFVGDITVDPENPQRARVRLFHPERGAAPIEGGHSWRHREQYLRERWNLLPRNREEGRFHAGWKNLALSDQRQRFALVHWFPTYWGEVFLTLYRVYLDTRPRANHPFLFVSERRGCRGEPYTLASFEQAHARAVRRIGLVPEKHRGTTAHGHRHAYGRALAEAKLDRLIVQRALHHRSPESQDVYTTADTAHVTQALRDATRRVWGSDTVPAPFQELVR